MFLINNCKSSEIHDTYDKYILKYTTWMILRIPLLDITKHSILFGWNSHKKVWNAFLGIS